MNNMYNTESTVLSKVFPNVMIDAIYDQENPEMYFIVKELGKNELDIVLDYTYNGVVYRPSSNAYISDGYIVLPSGQEIIEDPMKLKDEVKNFMKKYIELDETDYEIASRYAMLTWVYDKFQRIPYLRIIGDFGTGKSRFLDVMAAITYHSSKMGVGLTVANIYRWNDSFPGTLLLDEASFSTSDKANMMVQILNGGFDRNSPVFRSNPQSGDFQSRPFNTFGPKIMASRETYGDDSLESRFLTIRSKDKTRNDIPLNLPATLAWKEAAILRNKLLAYRLTCYNQVDPGIQLENIDGLEPRELEIIAPIAQILGEKVLNPDILAFIKRQSEELKAVKGMSLEGLFVEEIVTAYRSKERIRIVDLTQRLNSKNILGYKINAKRVGVLARSLGFQPHRFSSGFTIEPVEAQIKVLERRYGLGNNRDMKPEAASIFPPAAQ